MFRKLIFFALSVLALAGLACGLMDEIPVRAEKDEPQAAGEAGPDNQAGDELFAELNCSACHVAGAGHVAPSLAGLFGQSVPLESGETVTADEEYLRQSILFPQEKIVAGYEPVMPSFEGQLSEEELSLLVEYIKTLGN